MNPETPQSEKQAGKVTKVFLHNSSKGEGGETSVDAKTIDRINELARKSKSIGLTSEEKEEQAALRQDYIQAVRGNLRGQLNQIDVIERDGSIVNLGEKIKKKRKN